MNYQEIKFQVEEGIGFITLNCPEKRNALSMNLMAEMIDLSEMLGRDAVSYHSIFDVCTEMMEAIRNLPQPVIAQASPLTLALGKQSFYSQIELEEEQAYRYAKEMMSLNAMTEDAQEGISAFLQKRSPQWKGK